MLHARLTILIFTTAVLAGCGGDALSPSSVSKPDGVGPTQALTSANFPSFQKPTTQPTVKNTNPSDFCGRAIWQNQSTRLVACWRLNSSGEIADAVPIATTSNLDWTIKGTGDFNRDGQPDILWQHKTTRQLGTWFLNGNTVIGGGSLPTPSLGWDVVGVVDMDSDRNPDIVWFNGGSGQAAYWKLDGTSLVAAQSIPAPPATVNFRLQLVGEAPGRGPMLWWSDTSNGAIQVYLNGLYKSLTGIQPTEIPKAIGDVNGDGETDILIETMGTLSLSTLPLGFTNSVGGFLVNQPILGERKLLGSASASTWKFGGLLPPLRSSYTRTNYSGDLRDATYDATRQRVYLASTYNSEIGVYDTQQRKLLTPIPVGSPISKVHLSPQGDQLLAITVTGQLVRVDLSTNATAPLILPPTAGPDPRQVESLAWAADNHCVVCTTLGSSRDIWDLNLSSENWSSIGNTLNNTQVSLAASPDKTTIVCAISSGNGLRYVTSGGPGTNGTVSPLPGASWVEAVLADGRWQNRNEIYSTQGIWDLDTGFGEPGRTVISAVLDGQTLAQATTVSQSPMQLGLLDLTRNRVALRRQLPFDNLGVRLIKLVTLTPRELVAVTNTGLVHINLPGNLAPVVDAKALKVPVGKSAQILMSAWDPEGQNLSYALETSTADLQIDQASGRLTFHPTSDYPQPRVVNVLVSDGINETKQALQLETVAANTPKMAVPCDSKLDKLLVDSNRHLVYVSSSGSRQIRRYDYLNAVELSPIVVPGAPAGMNLSSDGSRLLVCEGASANLASVDLTAAVPSVTRRYPVFGPGQFNANAPNSVASTTSGLALVGTAELPSVLALNPPSIQVPVAIDLASGQRTSRTDLSQTHYATIHSSASHRSVSVPFVSNGIVGLNSLLAGAATLAPLTSQSPFETQGYFSADDLSIITAPELARYSSGTLGTIGGNFMGPFYWNGGPKAIASDGSGRMWAINASSLQAETPVQLAQLPSGDVAQSGDDAYRFMLTDQGLLIYKTP